MPAKLRLGTRGSKLALTQARFVSALVTTHQPEVEVEIVVVKTSGDAGNRDQVGAFVHEIQLAILNGTVDFGLHCLKDLPVDPHPDLALVAYLEREDPRDALIAPQCSITDLPSRALVGTGSLRRTSQISALRADLTFRPLVGNIDTRLRKLCEGEYQAIILAMAGLNRLGLLENWPPEFAELHATALPSAAMLPAAGQAVLVLEMRTDRPTPAGVAALDHPQTRDCALAERAFLKSLGGGCSMPIGALAGLDGDTLRLEGLVAEPSGRRILRGVLSGPRDTATALGEALASGLRRDGADEIIAALNAHDHTEPAL